MSARVPSVSKTGVDTGLSWGIGRRNRPEFETIDEVAGEGAFSHPARRFSPCGVEKGAAFPGPLG